MPLKPTISISILTPVFNQSRFIAETIESVLSQKYSKLEYLVLDDGSTDETLKIVKSYANRLIWHTQKNMGETATVNKGVQMLAGDIVGIVNGDDPLLPGALQAVAEFFMARPEIGVVYPDWKMIDAEGNLLETVTTSDYDYTNMVRLHYCIPGPGTFFRRELFHKLKGRNTNYRFVADFDFWLRAGLEVSFARIPLTLAAHRWYAEGASSAARGAEMAGEHIRMIDDYYTNPNLPQRILRVRNEAFSSAYFTAGVCSGENTNLKKEYFAKAIKSAPFKYLGEYRRRSLEMIKVYIPFLYQILTNLNRLLSQRKNTSINL